MPSMPKPFRPSYQPRARPTTAARGYGAAHQRARRQLLKREPICQQCRDAFATDMHHADRDTANRSAANLVALCERCHHNVAHGKG